uniref:Eukaryotic translation initiation factor 3 subunit L n=1 Tax=Rhodosorus marinus TaxID=101924 RepID=A0A7S3EEE9_9RHOD
MADANDGPMSWRRGMAEETGMGAGDERGGGAQEPKVAAALEELNRMEEEPKQYLLYFRAKFREHAVEEMHTLYEDNFVKISERYFKNSAWPSADAVSYLVDHDEPFLLLYKELTFRHMYTLYGKSQPSIREQANAWASYCDLFGAFLNGDMVGLDLPAAWLWDMVDEFIYQFEIWCQYRATLKEKSEEEIAVLRENDQIWNVNDVLQYLHALVNKSNICPWMLNDHQPIGSSDPKSKDFDLSSLAVYRYIGFFSIVGLLRINCLIGDYRLALMVLQSLDFNPSTSLFTHVTACQFSVYYFMGFAHMMLRRYEDAGRVFGTALLHVGRIKQSHVRSYQYEQVNKRVDQMLALLAICITFQPQYVDESTMSLLKDKFGDIKSLRTGEESTVMGLFTYASPKFVTPAPPNYDVIDDYHMDAANLQQKMFMAEIKQQLILPEIRSYLTLYTSIEVKQLADLMDIEEEMFRSHLLSLKHKSYSGRADVSGENPLIQGTDVKPSSELGFYINKNVVHVGDAKVETRFGEFFVKQIERLNQMSRIQIPRDVFHGAKGNLATR